MDSEHSGLIPPRLLQRQSYQLLLDLRHTKKHSLEHINISKDGNGQFHGRIPVPDPDPSLNIFYGWFKFKEVFVSVGSISIYAQGVGLESTGVLP